MTTATLPAIVQTPAPAPDRVTVRRAGYLLEIRPVSDRLIAALGPRLSFQRRVQGATGAAYQNVQLYDVDRGALQTTAPFLDRVVGGLIQAGINHQVIDQTERKRSEPNYEAIGHLRPEQVDMLAEMIAHDYGIFEAPTGAGKSHLVCELTKAWPEDRFVICCPLPGVLRQFYEDLKILVGFNSVGLVVPSQGYRELGRRITLVTDKSLDKVDPKQCDIFIWDEVHLAAAEDASQKVGAFRWSRNYGFSASPFGRSDNADLVTESLFGPLRMKVGYQQVQKTGSVVPITVKVVSTAGAQKLNFDNPMARERNCIWRHKYRNQQIAAAVAWCLHEYGADTQILISVKTVEHAVYLQQFLPNFALVYGTMDPVKRARWEAAKMLKPGDHPVTPEAREQMRRDFRNGKLLRAISTNTWGTGLNFPRLNVLIRADAQGSPIPNTQWPGRATRPDKASGKVSASVIDFDDSHNDVLAGRARRRFKIYRSKGWTIEALKPTPT